MESNSLQIKFEGQSHQIDANTLINTLIHYNAIISEINREYGQGMKTINIKVNALTEGSFIIDLSLVGLLGMFAPDGMSYLSDIIDVASGVFSAYKKLKGKPAKTEEEKSLISIGDVNLNECIINVYNGTSARQAISKSIETANEDTSVEGINLISNKTSVSYSKDEFPSLIYDDFDSEEDVPEERFVDEDVTLTITSLSFEMGGKWSFYFRGNKITINVKEGGLMDIISKGARFGKGDTVKVRLRTIQKYNQEYKTYVNKSYKILAFYEHSEAPKEPNLPMDEQDQE